MDIRKVKKLIEMLQESQLNEIEIKEGEESVKLVKAISVPVQEQIVTSNAVVASSAIRTSGLLAMLIAIIALCLCPPDNS